MTEPQHVKYVEFAKYSIADSQDPNNDKTTRKILIGDSTYTETPFHELFVERADNDIDDNADKKLFKNSQHLKLIYKSFQTDYHKKNACIYEQFSTYNAEYYHSFLLNNNKYLMVFDESGSNVYDIENDNWLLDKNDREIIYNDGYIPIDRVLLLTDEIFIITSHYELYFYFIDIKNDIAHPKLLKIWDLENTTVKYEEHGMIYTKFNIHTTTNTKEKIETTTLDLEIILFGDDTIDFFETFSKFNIKLSYVCNLKANSNSIANRLEKDKTSIQANG